ncbi:Cu(I)-responsive transcriptional regulator [Maritalea sp.]|uniref:Cu(I)-responsive transcriptional regulator n=1 Tax=Maritalea sp. TaxID=2003361 RepID=UPI003EF7A592
MNIGAAATRSGLPAKTIRYYEEIELVKPARSDNGYRDYCDEDIHRLCFLQRSRSLGFTIDECRTLLSLYNDEDRASSDVKHIAKKKIALIEQKVKELNSLKSTLSVLIKNCHGDDRPDCPILDDLAGRHVAEG